MKKITAANRKICLSIASIDHGLHNHNWIVTHEENIGYGYTITIKIIKE